MYENRVFGLDVMRCLGMFFVLILHSQPLLSKNFNVSFLSVIPDGVELFFVLSGYLIGRLIIRDFVDSEQLTVKTVINFLQRRLFRTIPNYYLFLIINILLITIGWIPGTLNKYLITYPVFLQNFHKPYDFLFWESWSLSVEEWFYFLLPNVVLFFSVFNNRRIKFLSIILLFIVVPSIIRIICYSEYLDFDLFFRKLVIMRLDACIYGVLIAFLMNQYYSVFKNQIVNIILLIMGIILFFGLNRILDNDFFQKTLYFNLQGIALMFCIPFLVHWKINSFQIKIIISHLSLMSYAVYLIHLPILNVLNYFLPPIENYQMIFVYLIYFIITFLLGHIVLIYYEKPLMEVREYLTRKIFRISNS
jgi:peptidoglycan/LPS O-acetylase OafA/YrhL